MNTNVNFPKNDFMLTFFKYWKVKTIVWNCIQIITKYKIDARKWIVYSMSTLVNNLFISCWLCESIKCATICIANIISRFEHLALKSPERTEQVGSSLFTSSIRVSKFVQKLMLTLTRWSVEKKYRGTFHFPNEFQLPNSYLETRDRVF